MMTVPGLLQAQTNVAVPLPALTVLVGHMTDAIAREGYYQSTFNQHYAYLRSRVSETSYSNGKFAEREEKLNTNSPPVEVASQPVPEYKPGSNEKPGSDKQLIDISELLTNVLAHAQLTVTGREMIEGRPTIVVSFQPPAQPIADDSLVERLINRGAGRAWVDEQDCTLAKLETHLLDKLNFLGGLGGAVYSGSYSFERERTPDGIWYARDIQWNADIRAVVLRRKLSYHEKYIDVHRPLAASVASREQATTTQ